MPSSPHWVIQSDTRKIHRWLLAMAALGVLFIYLARERRHESFNFSSAYWLGVFLLGLGLCIFCVYEDCLIEIDEERRKLRVVKKNLLRTKSYEIPFQKVQSVHVQHIGSRYRGIVTYHLILRLENNRTEKPGRFSVDQSEVIEVAERLARVLGCART